MKSWQIIEVFYICDEYAENLYPSKYSKYDEELPQDMRDYIFTAVCVILQTLSIMQILFVLGKDICESLTKFLGAVSISTE